MRRTMILVLVALAFDAHATDGAMDARQVMQRVEDRDTGDNLSMDRKMVLIDKDGAERTRELHSYTKDFGDDTYQLMFFQYPPDVKDTGFLTFDYKDATRDDDQWLYLPALKKTKRLAASDQSGSFVGSDFSFADLTSRQIDLYDYRILDEPELDGHATWRIEQTPRTDAERERTGYERSIVWVRKDNYVVVRAMSWLQKRGRMKFMQVKALEQLGDVWVPTEVHMATRQDDTILHRTVLSSYNLAVDDTLDPEFFSLRRLEQGH